MEKLAPAAVEEDVSTSASGSYRRPEELSEEELLQVLTRGALLKKYGRRGQPKVRFFWVVPTLDRLVWCDPDQKLSRPIEERRSVPVAEFEGVGRGAETKAFKRKASGSQRAYEQLAFSIETDKRSIDLEATSAEEGDLWVSALEVLMASKKKR